MKKYLVPSLLLLLSSGLLFGCGKTVTPTPTVEPTPGSSSDDTNQDNTDYESIDSTPDTSPFENIKETTNTFSLTSSDGKFTVNGNTYTLTSDGTYELSGALSGQIIVNAGADDEVNINLNGVALSNSSDSPIKITSADKVEISAKNGTVNFIKDTRSVKTSDNNNVGEGAISSSSDLKIKGKGILVVEASYNNGIHTTKDLKIKNLDLKVTAYNNALKGKNSVTIESGNIFAISTNGDGIKTENSDISSSGNQKGSVTVTGGMVNVYAAGDGISSSYDFVSAKGTEGLVPVINVFTGNYNEFTASNASTTSYKGIKVNNIIDISFGKFNLYSFDDGLHANYGTKLENGNKGLGNINISGGCISTAVYSPSKSGGAPGGWNGQKEVSGADGIHADNTINITGGTINIDSAYEGLEANHLNVTGGTTTIYATDDGINASKKIDETPTIVISGGRIDVTISGGDVDGIDSNGTFTQTGGVVVTRGAMNSNNNMASGLDCDGAAKVTGGTFICFGSLESTPSKGSSVYSLSFDSTTTKSSRPGPGGQGQTSSTAFSAGTWTISTLNIQVVLTGTYYGCSVYSNSLVSGNSYTISNGTTSYSGSAQ